MSIQSCIDNFIRDYRLKAQQEMAFYKDQKTLHDAIIKAANCQRPDGKREPHQRRIPRAVLCEARNRLIADEALIENAQNFEHLHSITAALIKDIRGIGELTIYDIASRIGAFLGLSPQQVYLHAGTRDGASALGLSGKTIAMDQLPPEFQALTPAEIEDFLCIYKNALNKTGVVSTTCLKPAQQSRCYSAPKTP